MKIIRSLLRPRVWQTTLILLLVVGLTFAGWGRLLASLSEDVAPRFTGNAVFMDTGAGLPTATAAAEQVAPPLSFTGDIRAKDRIVLASKAPARIKEIRGEVGDPVKKGAMIIELDHDLLDAQVKQGEAALSLAEAQLAKLLSGSRKEQIAIAEANLAGAQADLDLLLAGSRKEQIEAA